VLMEAGCALTIGPFAPAVLIGDLRLLQQLFVNLLENVALHTGPGTHARIALHREGEEAVVTLADDGPGLPEADRARVLRPFERGQAQRATRGSGLGLAIAHAVMRFHAGTLRLLDGAPGMIVELRFPAHATEPAFDFGDLAGMSSSTERFVTPAA
jgi:signal transduction histidine kinase